jgi:hypothetical protein
LHSLPNPFVPAIFGTDQKSIVSANPASFVVEKVNRIQILICWSYARRHPSLLALN